jgi:hypothetical protein
MTLYHYEETLKKTMMIAKEKTSGIQRQNLEEVEYILRLVANLVTAPTDTARDPIIEELYGIFS